MEKYFPVLEKCPLFDGISREDIRSMMGCLGGRVTTAAKNQIIFHEGDPATHVGIVLSGNTQLVREDLYGNRSIISRMVPGELFAESFACAQVGALPVSVVAEQDSVVMIIDCHRITVSCSSACSFHSRLIFNLLKIVATRNLAFDRKLEITSRRTTREKLIAYLLDVAKSQGTNTFTIPYDRQGLADYLGVERSAMSVELGKLRRDGVIDFDKSRFTIL